MIKKLRIKFIAITMLSLFLVLALILGTINIINYHNIVEDADATLEVLQENQGSFPTEQYHQKRALQDTTVQEEEDVDEFDEDDLQPVPGTKPGTDASGQNPPAKPSGENIAPPAENREDWMKEGHGGLSRETPYSARYFWVFFDENGEISETNTDRIISVDEEQAEEYAEEVLEKGKERGFKEDFRYVVSEEEEGIRVIFLDCWSDLSTFRDFLRASCLIALAGMLAVFLLIFFLSSRIVKPISDSYEKQKRFITDAGHEIKTPLAIIDADAEVLEMDVGEDNEWITDIRQQIKRLTGLTNDLVALSRMEEGGENLLKTEFSYSEALEEIAQPFRSLAKIQGKELEIDIQEDVDFYGDEKSIRQLTSILMDNAMKYSADQSTVTLKAGKNGRGVFLEVANVAENLKKEDTEYLFDRFYRADSSRNSEKGGHGIGLSLARAITEAHGGKIQASLAGDQRLKIAVYLPFKKQSG